MNPADTCRKPFRLSLDLGHLNNYITNLKKKYSFSITGFILQLDLVGSVYHFLIDRIMNPIIGDM